MTFILVYSLAALAFLIVFNLLLKKRSSRNNTLKNRPKKTRKPAAAEKDTALAKEETLQQNQTEELLPAAPSEEPKAQAPSKNNNYPDHLVTLLMVLILGAFVTILNQTLLNNALPKIMNSFNVTTNTAQWLSTAYMLVNGVVIPFSAFLIETISSRKLFIFAMSMFGIGTLIAGVAPTFSILLIGRMVQAVGAGIIMPLMTTLFMVLFPPEKRGSVMGIMGVAMIFAPAIGPTLSGYIVEYSTWRLLFWVVLPIALLDIILALIYFKDVGERSYPKLDVWGLIFSTIGLSSLLYGFSEAGNDGWTSTTVEVTIAIGVIFLIAFVVREFLTDHPLLNLRVFKFPIFTLASVINLIVTMSLFASMILLPVYLQNIRGFTPVESGLLLLPGAIIMGIMSPIAGALFDKVGARPLAIVGLLVMIFTTWEFGNLTLDDSLLYIGTLYTIRSFGISLVMMPIMTEALNSVPRELSAHATATFNTLRQIAGSLGTAILVTVMSTRTNVHREIANSVYTTNNMHFMQSLQEKIMHLMQSMGISAQEAQQTIIGQIVNYVSRHSAVQGINDAFIVATLVTILGLIVSIFLSRAKIPGIHKTYDASNESK